MSLSIVIPCFRSSATLPSLVRGIDAVLAPEPAPYEVVLVVDDDRDDTWAVATELAARSPAVRVIRLARNYGQHNALVAGIRAARHDVIITMDDDLQHPPEEIPVLLRALAPHFDLVYGVAATEEHNVARSFASRLVKRALATAMQVPDAGSVSAFRAFRAHLTPAFDQLAGPHACIDVTLSWATSRVTTATIQMRRRQDGQSGYTLGALLRHTGNMVFGYSTAPLRLVTGVGVAIGVIGSLLAVQLAWAYFRGTTTVAGFTTIATMVALFASAQLVALGVLGEYVGRIHTGGMGRPAYIIRESAGPGSHAPQAVAESGGDRLVQPGQLPGPR